MSSVGRRPLSELDLTAEQRAAVGETIASAVAVNVYKELNSAREAARAAGGGCNIIGNCSSSCSSGHAETVERGGLA